MLAALIILLIVCIILLIIYNRFAHKQTNVVSNNYAERFRNLYNERNNLQNQYVLDVTNNTATAVVVKNKIDVNQQQLVDTFSKMYGNSKANDLNNILTNDNNLLYEVIDKARYKQPNERLVDEWYNNGGKFSSFLKEAENNFDESKLHNMVKDKMDENVRYFHVVITNGNNKVVNSMKHNELSDYMYKTFVDQKHNWVN